MASYPSNPTFSYDGTNSPNNITGAIIDAGEITRDQYHGLVLGGAVIEPIQLAAQATFAAGDVSGLFAGWVLGIAYVLMPDANWKGTWNDVLTGAKFYKSRTTRTTAGVVSDLLAIPTTDLKANTKYWLAAWPAMWDPTAPLDANVISLVSRDTAGRSISFFTNRTPAAPTMSLPGDNETHTIGVSATFNWNQFFGNGDPDSTDSGVFHRIAADQRGWQIQIRPAPTQANPDPAWANAQVKTSTGYKDAVCLEASSTAALNDSTLYTVNSMSVRCGSSGITTGQILVSPGKWQIRMRTFDYGMGPTAVSNGLAGQIPYASADNVPAANTSPWSTPRGFIVTAPTPPPIPLSPINDFAWQIDNPVVVTWQFVSTENPVPGTQTNYTVQVREAGNPTWTTVASNVASAANFYTVSGFTFEVGFRYEWQVSVKSTSIANGAQTSDFSQSGFFRIIPAPNSGTLIEPPTDTTQTFELGCGRHRVYVYQRGGQRRIGEITECSKVQWGRSRDAISQATVEISGWSIDCGNLVSMLHTWQHELVLYRDMGLGYERVWEGPVMLPSYDVDKVTVTCYDVMQYPKRRIIKNGFVDNGDVGVVTRAKLVMQDVLATDDPNMLQYLVPIENTDDTPVIRSVGAYTQYASELIDDMAANGGLDYTAVGRAVILWGTHREIGRLPELRDGDFDNDVNVTEYGSLTSTHYVVTDGSGNYGEAFAPNSDALGYTDLYGLVEMLATQSDTTSATGVSDAPAITTLKQSLSDKATKQMNTRYPSPVVVRIPDNSRLMPHVPIGINQLVPGVSVPLRSTKTLRKVRQKQKLDSMQVTEVSGNETITIVLSPFPISSADDLTEDDA